MNYSVPGSAETTATRGEWMVTDQSGIAVECYARASSLAGPVEDAVDALYALDAAGRIDDLTVWSWPAEVALSDLIRSRAVECFFRFQRWAAARGASVRPAFALETREYVTGERQRVLITPVVCLAVYAGDELRGVYPHSTEDAVHTVRDAIEALERGEFGTGSGRPRSTTDDACPVCGDALLDGQGLYTCPGCGWTGRLARAGQHRRPRLRPPAGGPETAAGRRLAAADR